MNVSAYKLPPTFSRGGLAPAIAGHRVHSSHSSFSRRSFFEPPPRRSSAIDDRGYRSGSNEVETGKYSGSWLPRPAMRVRILFPAFTVLLWRQPCRLLLRMQAARLPLQRLALGNRIQSQQRNCSRISRDSSRRSTTTTDKELPPEVAACAWAFKISLCADAPHRRRPLCLPLKINPFSLRAVPVSSAPTLSSGC